MKVIKETIYNHDYLTYKCNGCKTWHRIKISGEDSPKWTWNNDINKPIISPSILVRFPANPYADDDSPEWKKDRICHTFIGCNGAQAGEVIFLNDCTHELAGQVHPMPDCIDDD